MCSICQVDPAKSICLCDYPVHILCQGQCVDKHRKIPGFHFEMPVSQLSSVNRDNFSANQTWIFGLSRAHQALRKNIAAIEAFEVEIEASFGQIEREIADLKGEYKAAIQTLKRNIADMIDFAIGETTAQALTSDPQFSSPLSATIWESAHPGNTTSLQLYRLSVNIADKGAILPLICAEVQRNYPILPEFSLKNAVIFKSPTVIQNVPNSSVYPSLPQYPAYENAETTLRSKHFRPATPLAPQESLPYKRISAPFSNQIATIQPAMLLSTPQSPPNICKSCGFQGSAKFHISQCPNVCECRLCLIEAILEPDSLLQCLHCNLPYSQTITIPILADYTRCHSCGLAVQKKEIDTEVSCHPCKYCISVGVETSYWLFSTQIHICSACEPCEETSARQYGGKGGEKLSACCERSLDGGRELGCGHFVCNTHETRLKRCRACHKKVSTAR